MNRQVYEEASEWLVEFRTEEADPGVRRRFQAWLSKSPEHVQAYLEVSSVWETVSAQPRADACDVDALIERARSGATVVSMPTAAGSPETRRERAALFSRRSLFATAAILLFAIIGAGAHLYTQRNTYTTAIGEQRSILLPDGSTIDLNARSKVRVRLDRHERHIDLLQGQALFRVAKDKARPFIVAANGTRVRAVGTQFDVNQRKRGVTVTVVEGTVAVYPTRLGPSSAPTSGPTPPPTREILLDAGQTVTLAAAVASDHASHEPSAPRPADIETATAWTQRRLIFDSTLLDDVAEEFNRNNTRPLVIEGEGLEDFHVSGAFSSTDPQPLLRFLRAQTGIQVKEQSDRIVVSRSE